ncbi:MAG: hypothetical protein E6X17_03740 [Sporomusaceae bacterium]|nr:hypothetical protein [Sporomusaceae bacterium]
MEDTQLVSLNASNPAGMQTVLSLMQVQHNYISQLYGILINACSDGEIARNREFAAFAQHFLQFVQHHSSSLGFTQALDTIRVYHFVLLELLLDTQIVAAAEQLELAISSLESVQSTPAIAAAPQLTVLHYGMDLLEEVQLNIITLVEEMVAVSRRGQLQN